MALNERLLNLGRERVANAGMEATIGFERKVPEGLKAKVIVSQNSFEHFLDAEDILRELRARSHPAENSSSRSRRLVCTMGRPYGFFLTLSVGPTAISGAHRH